MFYLWKVIGVTSTGEYTHTCFGRQCLAGLKRDVFWCSRWRSLHIVHSIVDITPMWKNCAPGSGFFPRNAKINYFLLLYSSVSKHIGTQDSKYASLFLHESWKELLEMAEPSKVEVSDMVTRVCQYLAADSNENLINLPVAEAMGKKIALKR